MRCSSSYPGVRTNCCVYQQLAGRELTGYHVYAGTLSGSMASQELKRFLRVIDSDYVVYADVLHHGSFKRRIELAAADRKDLENLGIPIGPAGAIIRAAQGTAGSSS